MSESNRAAVHSYRRIHLRMQASERLLLERNIQTALSVNDVGQPLQAVMLSDGMTERKGICDIVDLYVVIIWLTIG